ncbi:aspartate aminotransferase family protein [Tindallia californiensis]|uniref:Acetylornithine aminotransferase n=1 Tax=Tindallia californiensis TaxID=159292 RepID=A0A1H3IG54_9FIRM|nr:aspartate aminotransferase family protein [Tindallia californiensis]SDY26670.1 acetylornithine aminotransferase apoenzyme [Tindallia californiensis]
MLKNEFIRASEGIIMNTYKRVPVVFVEGKDCMLIDSEGNKYLDMVGGLAASGMGHSPDFLVEAIMNQAKKLMHVTNYYWNEPQYELAKLLVDNSFGDKVFFCNSGAEANEAALKLARKYGYKMFDTPRYEIVTVSESFHGRTLGTLSATAKESYREGYKPLPEGFKQVPFNDVESLENAVSEKTCAIMFEPLQGEGGLTQVSEAFVNKVNDLAKKQGLLIIVDEIQCGLGRTGAMFAYEQYGIIPDIMSLAKTMAGGFPIGAIVATEKVADAWNPGDHGTTFGGNPLACAAGAATMKEIINQNIPEKVKEDGAYLIQKLQMLKEKYDFVKQVKGKGLMVGLELNFPGDEIVRKAFDKKLIINCTSGKVLRFLPPMVIKKEEIDLFVNTLDQVFQEVN